jgi:hypothetical protein
MLVAGLLVMVQLAVALTSMFGGACSDKWRSSEDKEQPLRGPYRQADNQHLCQRHVGFCEPQMTSAVQPSAHTLCDGGLALLEAAWYSPGTPLPHLASPEINVRQHVQLPLDRGSPRHLART